MENLAGFFVGVLSAHTVDQEGHRNVFKSGQCGQKVVSLKNKADVCPAVARLPSLAHSPEIIVEDQALTFIVIENPGHDGNEGRFPAS
jgi:hypothetical protein